MHTNDNNMWGKSTTYILKMKKIVTYIADVNFYLIPKWRSDNPSSEEIMSRKQLEHAYP